MSSKEILINSNTMKGMETDVASSTMGIKKSLQETMKQQ